MGRRHPTNENWYWCPDCRIYKFCDPQNDDLKVNEFYITSRGHVDGVCKIHRKIRNVKYRPEKKYDDHGLLIGKKHQEHQDAEVGTSKLAGINRGRIEGFKRYFSQNRGLFKEIYQMDYSDGAAEMNFNKTMGIVDDGPA
jgi:hypothetical protein